ncbi:MAG: hypothetical protein C0505_15155 [Leptothrix sp. (in: Bacteria)]|nr:hypothetical protein [Leptothrix sp. (in: b-proteobacteria)]
MISTAGMAAMWEPLQLASDTPRQPDHGRGHVGLGWRIDRYRDTVRIAHGGDLNGFTSRVVLLPQKNAGLVILVNHGSHPLPNAVTPDLLDRLLGLSPEGHSAKALARRDAAEAARLAAGAASGAGRPAVAGAGPSRPLAAYAGRYVHQGYGEVQVAARGDGLEVHYNGMPAALEHRHFDVFETRTERPEHGDFNALKLVFQGDEQGRLSGFSARLQDGVRPIEFKHSA